MTLEDDEKGDNKDLDIDGLDDEPLDQLYWDTKTEMLGIVEEDFKLKLELKEMRRQFLTILQDFKEFDNCTDTDCLYVEATSNQSPEIPTISDDQQQIVETGCQSTNNQDSNELPRSNLDITNSQLEMESNNSSFLSEFNPLPDAAVEEECINRYFAGLQLIHQEISEDDDKNSMLPVISNGSSFCDLTAPNQTAASESTSNWDNVYINNLSKQEEPGVEYEEKGAKPKRLKVYIQNIPWDTSSDSSYNVPCPNVRPQLHPELMKALAASRNAKSTSSMESSLANISDITKYSEMSSRWVNSQNDASDYNSCSPEDLPHQSTPTKGGKHCESKKQSPGCMQRVSPTGGHANYDLHGQFATPVARIQGSDICSSLDDSTPIVIQRTRRHLFPGEDSGITGSASDYTSSPSTMRENSNIQGPKMDRDKFLLMDENRTFNYKPSSGCERSRGQESREMFFLNNAEMSMDATRDSEANTADITTFSPPDAYSANSCDATSSSSNISPMTSGVSSSYKESDGKSSPFTESIDMALRTTIDGEEAYNQMVANLKASDMAKCSVQNTPTNKHSSSTRPPCIGKEATPENNTIRKVTHIDYNITKSPQKDLTKDMMINNNDVDFDGKQSSSDSSKIPTKPPLPGYDDLKKKVLAPPERPNFTSYDGGDSVVKPVVLKEEELSSKEVINVDQYARSTSPTKDGKKKTFFKKLKGFRKHFRSNSRSKAYVKTD